MKILSFVALVCGLCSLVWVSATKQKEQDGAYFTSKRENGDEFYKNGENGHYQNILETLREILSHEITREDNQEIISSKARLSRRTLDNNDLNLIVKNDHSSELPVQKKYLNEWVVHMSGGEETARTIANELGYKFIGPVKGFDDMYIISHLREHHNNKRETRDITSHINSHAQVIWAEQQVSKLRVKRNHKNQVKQESQQISSKIDIIMKLKSQERMFDDPLWKHQWYLFDSRTRDDLPKLDLKVISVWKSGITGKGVNVVVVDDGLEWNHTEFLRNYNANISYDLNDDDVDPSPRYDVVRTNSHGTKCAGEIAMEPNNGKCGVGVAFGVSIGGIRMLDGDVSDRLEGAALTLNHQSVDIISCSWGPNDDGIVVEGPGTLANMALKKGVLEGRKGKGTIYVWASGNGGSVSDNCNCDGYVSSIYTIGVNTASEDGDSPWYSEHCASTLTSTYSSGAYIDQKIITTDIEDDCTINFSGTSAAAPLAAGIIALALEANPSLSWRDVQHIIVRASEWLPLSDADGWQANGAGYHFNMKFGFGLLTGQPLVNLARNWTTVPEKKICENQFDAESETVIESGDTVEMEVTSHCNTSTQINQLEHVQVLLTLNHTKRGSLNVRLISSQGTVSNLLTPRPKDNSEEGFDEWPFMSVHFWGENPNGSWKLIIQDTSQDGLNGTIYPPKLILHGIAEPN